MRIGECEQYEIVGATHFGAPIIKTTGYRRRAEAFNNGMYKTALGKLEPTNLTFIPYFGFANRGESEMVVWVLKK